jgi:hypothetical protein
MLTHGWRSMTHNSGRCCDDAAIGHCVAACRVILVAVIVSISAGGTRTTVSADTNGASDFDWVPVDNRASGFSSVPAIFSSSNTLSAIRDDLDAVVATQPGSSYGVILTDFDDLHESNVFYDSVSTRGLPGSRGIDIAYVQWLGNSDEQEDFSTLNVRGNSPALDMRDELSAGIDGGLMGPSSGEVSGGLTIDPRTGIITAPRNDRAIGIVYGTRMLQLRSAYTVAAIGSILGDSYWDTAADNNVFGPQLGLVWSEKRGPLHVEAQGALIAGYNLGRTELYSSMGSHLIPGALNRPLYERPTEYCETATHHEFCPAGEFRIDAQVSLLKSISLNFGWNGLVVLNVVEAENSTTYVLPVSHLNGEVGGEYFVNNLYCNLTCEY